MCCRLGVVLTLLLLVDGQGRGQGVKILNSEKRHGRCLFQSVGVKVRPNNGTSPLWGSQLLWTSLSLEPDVLQVNSDVEQKREILSST